MTRKMVLTVAGAALLALLLAAGAIAAPMTHTGNLDIGAMMDEAQDAWDFDELDSVILLEGIRYTWTEDGRLEERHHRVVWISTEHGIDHYADLRVPYDSDRQELTVDALRVYRNERWIEARETAVVPTTPYAFRSTPAYTGIRETMLLHDGVELPCILEVDYTIADKQAYRNDFQGQWLFQHTDPALNSWLILETPEPAGLGSTQLFTASLNGAPEPTSELPGGNAPGMMVKSYRMTQQPAAPRPATNDPAQYLPAVQFSTWPNWQALGEEIKGTFLSKLQIGQSLSDSLAQLTEDAETMNEKAHRVAEFVKGHMRFVHYDPVWFMPRVRPASEVYASGYGVAWDIAVLTGGLMREAGFEVWPVLLGKGYGGVSEGVATVARFQPPGVWVSGPGVEAYFDAESGTLHNGLAPIFGRSIWLPGYDEEPTVRWTGEGDGSRMLTSFELTWNGDGWDGSGYFEAGGGMSPYDQMEGGRDRTKKYLGGVVGSVISGAELDGFSPMSFDRFTVASDVNLTLASGERDALGRLPMVFGSPNGGVLAGLPGDVHLYLAERQTPVVIGGSKDQMVKVTLHPNGLELVHLPDPVTVENDAGRFEVSVRENDGKVTVTRSLSLNKGQYSAEEWPALRELLLAEANDNHRTVLLQ